MNPAPHQNTHTRTHTLSQGLDSARLLPVQALEEHTNLLYDLGIPLLLRAGQSRIPRPPRSSSVAQRQQCPAQQLPRHRIAGIEFSGPLQV